MTDTVTLDRLKAARFRWFGHINMGRNGHLQMWQCEDFPRLSVSKLTRRGETTRTITVVGHDVADFGEAAARLNGPPIEPPGVEKEPPQLELGL